jgi:hypothetical protein
MIGFVQLSLAIHEDGLCVHPNAPAKHNLSPALESEDRSDCQQFKKSLWRTSKATMLKNLPTCVGKPGRFNKQ